MAHPSPSFVSLPLPPPGAMVPFTLRSYLLAALVVLLGVPLAMLYRDASQRGQPFGDYLVGLVGSTDETGPDPSGSTAPGAAVHFLEPRPIGEPIEDTPQRIAHVAVVDLDQDGRLDVLVCDGNQGAITWIRQEADGTFRETTIADSLPAPARVSASDIDGDGDLDLLVAVMGTIAPNNNTIGAVVLLENDGAQRFVRHVLAERVARVTDIQTGDFDGDGDVDLVVGQFGYYDGEIRWMENRGGWRFDSHVLLDLAGTIHTPVGDLDGDGDLDIAAVVSQQWEEIYVFENDGLGRFQRQLVYGSTNDDFGSSGLSLADLDLDGDLDMLYTNGDAFDYSSPGPRPWHGVQWLENRGGLEFEYHRIGDFPGAFSGTAVDADRDGDMDVFVVSAFNDWDDPDAHSLGWFENDGSMRFTYHDLASAPTHLVTLTSADLDGDGWTDFVTGGMHVYPPFDRMSRVTWWKNDWPGRRQSP